MSRPVNMKSSGILPPPPESLNEEEAIEGIRRMFVDVVQRNHIVKKQQTPAKRAAFIKQHGVAIGQFEVADYLDEKYQVGIFKTPGARYTAWVRYSSDVPDDRPDLNTTVGIGIKLFGVPGIKALEGDEHATTLDFILQNTEVFFAADAREMNEFKSAALNGTLDKFLESHPETDRILKEMEERTVESVLTEPLWSCIPYKFGENDYCKFSLIAETNKSVAGTLNQTNKYAPNYLADDMAKRLSSGDVVLNFFVQLRNKPKTQSITNARSLWDEKESIPVKVATLTLFRQMTGARNQGDYGESLAFNIWRTLPEMVPVGSIAEARKVVYRSSAQIRRQVNGQSIGEPTEARWAGARMPAYQPTFELPWPDEKSLPSPEVLEAADGVLNGCLTMARVVVPGIGLTNDDIVLIWFNGKGINQQKISKDQEEVTSVVGESIIKEAQGQENVEVFYTVIRNNESTPLESRKLFLRVSSPQTPPETPPWTPPCTPPCTPPETPPETPPDTPPWTPPCTPPDLSRLTKTRY